MNRDEELCVIAMEECAEVQQALSKIIRFGENSEWLGETGTQILEKEIGDLLCLFDLMSEREWISWNRVHEQAEKKAEKLKTWSNLYAS